jgi:exonuclease III
MYDLSQWTEVKHLISIDKREKTYSWYSHQGNGFRYDHIWAHQDILPVLKNCYYVQDVRTDKISDHAMQVLEFQS